MNIKEEYARLLELSKNKEGFQQVNDLWQVASGYERRADGFWYKNCIGCGNLVA